MHRPCETCDDCTSKIPFSRRSNKLLKEVVQDSGEQGSYSEEPTSKLFEPTKESPSKFPENIGGEIMRGLYLNRLFNNFCIDIKTFYNISLNESLNAMLTEDNGKSALLGPKASQVP